MEIIPIIVQVLSLGAILLVVAVFISFIISKFKKKDISYNNQFITYPSENLRAQLEENKTLKLKIETTDIKDKKNGDADNSEEIMVNRKQKNSNRKSGKEITPRFTVLNEIQNFKNNYDILDLNFRSYNSDNPL